MQIKKESQTDYNKYVKILNKNFRFLDQHYVRLLFEFCEYDPIKTYKVLEILREQQLPSSFIKKLVDFPNDSDQLISGMQEDYHKKYGNKNVDLFDGSNAIQPVQKKYIGQCLDFNFFSIVPRDVCSGILAYLDPFSFSNMSQTCMKFYLLSKSEATEFYFKNLCIKVFKNDEPILPAQTNFTEIREYVQAHPIQYGPNITNAVMNNLRYFVWKSQPKQFRVDNAYYKSFGNYRNLFLQGPRVHFNGFYVCKHKYVKLGEKGLTHTVTPLHVIYYYRYIRFFQDGSLLCCVSSNKIKKQSLSKILSRQNLQHFDPRNTLQLKIGQYIQHQNTLYMKIVKCNTIFSYQIQINSTQSKIANQLMVLSYTLQLVDEKEIIQNLYTYKPYKQKVIFNYLRNQIIEEENNPIVRAASL